MKNLSLLLLAMLLLIACGGKSATDTPQMTLKCRGNVCIQQAFLSLTQDGDRIRVDFDLTDPQGEVSVGAEPSLEDAITVGLFLAKDDTYLWGARIASDYYMCYAGNDIAWSDGKLAALCGFTVPLNQLQIRPELGDGIRVEALEFDFEQTVVLDQD
jgi:hypothetical protein